MRMREPMLTPEQAAATRRAALQERERLHAAAEERRELILQVRAWRAPPSIANSPAHP